MNYTGYDNVEVLLGKTLVNIERKDSTLDWSDGDELIFTTSEGEQFAMYHCQDCCESVNIEDICGDLNDLIGNPLLMAEEVSGDSGEKDFESYTWTFYKFATIKGYVTIRWLGTSNGYYSESVNFRKL